MIRVSSAALAAALSLFLTHSGVWAAQQARGKGTTAIERAAAQVPATISVESKAFGPQESIPQRYSAYGQGVSPPLSWSNLPRTTRSLVLVVEDPDAPTDAPFVHWLMASIPPTASGVAENASAQAQSLPGPLQGENSTGSLGYFGPRPPHGDGPHHYHFQVFALDRELGLQPGFTRRQLLARMEGHVLATGELVGRYQAH